MQAVIFDMDGVISDTERLQCIAESEVLSKYGIVITAEDMIHRFSGMPGKKVWEILFQEHGKGLPPEQALRDAKFSILFKIAKKNIQAIAGSIAFIQTLNAANIPCAIASSSLREFIDIVINELKIATLFNAIVSGTEVKNGKPAPDIFLLAAKRLNISPNECIVIEDATRGVTAAKTAGMKCIGFKPAGSRQDLSMADLVVADFQEITLNILKSL